MIEALILGGFTMCAWLVHGLFVTLYSKLIPDTKSLRFRAVHTAEIFITVAVMLVLFHQVSGEELTKFQTAGIILATLVAVDAGLLLLNEKLRDSFDIFHFAAAYGSVVAAVVLI